MFGSSRKWKNTIQRYNISIVFHIIYENNSIIKRNQGTTSKMPVKKQGTWPPYNNCYYYLNAFSFYYPFAFHSQWKTQILLPLFFFYDPCRTYVCVCVRVWMMNGIYSPLNFIPKPFRIFNSHVRTILFLLDLSLVKSSMRAMTQIHSTANNNNKYFHSKFT